MIYRTHVSKWLKIQLLTAGDTERLASSAVTVSTLFASALRIYKTLWMVANEFLLTIQIVT
jgi:hypothetical protein